MAKQVNVRLDDIHFALLEAIVKRIEEEGTASNRTDAIEKAIYNLANNVTLGEERTKEIISDVFQERMKETMRDLQ